MAAERRPYPARGCRDRPFRADVQRERRYPGQAGHGRHHCGVARNAGGSAWPAHPRRLGFRRGVCGAVRFRQALSLRPRKRGLLDPHHHRHPRGPDLHVPDDRGTLLPWPPGADVTAAPGGRHGRQLCADRSRSVALRPDRPAIFARAGRGRGLPEVGHRDTQCAFQCHDRRDRAGGDQIESADAADGPNRRRQILPRTPRI